MASLRHLGHRLYTGDISYDFVGHKRRWYILSLILIVVSIGSLSIRGLSLGIEFEGGADFQVKIATVNPSTVDVYRAVIANSGLPDIDDTTVTTIGSDRVRVQTRSLSVDEVTTVRGLIAKQAGVSSGDVAYNLIGPTWGSQISQRALIALIVFLVLVTIVIWATFRDWKMSIAALVALLHDLLITVGVYSLVGFSVAPATLIGVLTILGYSLYDTVVVFDKVGENVHGITGNTTRTFSEAANHAVNQVLVRSLNTTVIGVLPVAALLFAGAVILGEGPLKDLSLALFVGMIIGAYSSIFIATPLLAQMREREPQMTKLRHRVENRRAKLAGRSAPHVLEEPATATKQRKRAAGRYDSADLAMAEAEVAHIHESGIGGRSVNVDVVRGGEEPRLTSLGISDNPATRSASVDPSTTGQRKRATPAREPDPTKKQGATKQGPAKEPGSTKPQGQTRPRDATKEPAPHGENEPPTTPPRDTSVGPAKRPQPRRTPRSKRKK